MKARKAVLKGGSRSRRRRGHWPAGKRRNRPGVSDHELRGLLADVMTVTRDPERGPYANGVSICGVAAYCRVNDRTVRRWLDGTDIPSAPAVRRIKSWLSKVSR